MPGSTGDLDIYTKNRLVCTGVRAAQCPDRMAWYHEPYGLLCKALIRNGKEKRAGMDDGRDSPPTVQLSPGSLGAGWSGCGPDQRRPACCAVQWISGLLAAGPRAMVSRCVRCRANSISWWCHWPCLMSVPCPVCLSVCLSVCALTLPSVPSSAQGPSAVALGYMLWSCLPSPRYRTYAFIRPSSFLPLLPLRVATVPGWVPIN